MKEPDVSLLDAARAFQAEYDGLRSSRVIAAYLKLRNRFARHPYEPLELEAAFPPEKAWMRLAARENAGNRHFYEHRADYIARLEVSNGSGYFRNAARPRVGIITDEFMFDYYDGPLELTYLHPKTYRQAIDEGDLDFVLYVTCWHGRHDQVDNYYENGPTGHARISAVLSYARKAGLPIVFQSIEDPPSYHLYLDLARQADFVFTSCEEKIPDYVRDLGHYRVFSCKFGVNPELNNPVGIGLRDKLGNEHLRNTVLFAGSWYDEYPERCADTELIFDALVDTGRNLAVFDRRWPVDWAGVFPEKYWHYVLPGVNHKELQAITKLFDFAVNLNSVKDSRTMCAMRTYELQAAGVIGIANDALALEAQFPELARVRTAEDVRRFFADASLADIRRMQTEGIRRVMGEHTVYDRLNEMFAHMGMDFRYPAQRIAVLADPDCPQECENASALVRRVPHASVVFAPRDPATELLPALDGYRFFMRAPNDRSASEAFLLDAVNAFKYVDVACVQACAPNSPKRFSFASEAPLDGPCLFDKERIEDCPRAPAPEGASTRAGFAKPRFTIPYETEAVDRP